MVQLNKAMVTQEGPGTVITTGKTASAALDMGSARILLADQDVLSRRMVAAALDQSGYDIVEVSSGDLVMQALEDHAVDIVILDVGIPNIDGATVTLRIHQDRRYADLPVMLLSSPSRHEEAVHGLDAGADDIIMKPVDPNLLIARVHSALRMRRALLGMEAAHAVVATLANEINYRDSNIELHTERLSRFAAELGRRVGLSTADLHAVAYGTLLHDLGKIGISEAILLKSGPLTEAERAAMQRHTEIGERIAAPLAGSDRFGPIIRHHHERWDGNGYPDRLLGKAIPMGARIIAVVDAFDAMTQFRPYREPRSVPEAVAELRNQRELQFDPNLVDIFVRVVEWDGLSD